MRRPELRLLLQGSLVMSKEASMKEGGCLRVHVCTRVCTRRTVTALAPRLLHFTAQNKTSTRGSRSLQAATSIRCAFSEGRASPHGNDRCLGTAFYSVVSPGHSCVATFETVLRACPRFSALARHLRRRDRELCTASE